MKNLCDRCRQPYVGEESVCAHCAATANGAYRNGSAQAVHEAPHASDAEIDLDQPVKHMLPDDAGPPSGASFTSWTDQIPCKSGADPAPLGSISLPRIIAGPPEEMPDDAEIDLDRPTRDAPSADNGPPSGASFASWTTLVRPREERGDETPAPAPRINRLPPLALYRPRPPRIEEAPPARTARGLIEVPPEAAPATWMQRHGWLLAVALGLLVGIGICVGLWSVGYEPPSQWRQKPAPAASETP